MNTEPRRLGKYELHACLARGGQGEVWKAFDPQLRRYVAIKQLHANLQSDPNFISRFEREAQFIAALHHPNIVQIHDFQFILTPGSDTTTAYMVMDYIEGPTLANYIHNTSRKGQFPDAADIVYIFTAVSLAIDYAHEKGMIHRDIKPANIMLDKRSPTARSMGQPILTDFGIAKLQGAFADITRVIGTPLYASPEQARGLSGDKRSDLYSLGIILYEMTTGVTPFRGDSLMAILMQHHQDTPPPPAFINRTIPPALSEVILKSIAKDPDARFQSASAMTIALAEALNVPVPAELRKTDSSPALMSISDPHNPLQPSPPPGMTPPPSPPSGFQHSPLPVSTAFTNGSATPSMIPVDGRLGAAQFSNPGMNVSGAVMPPPLVAAPAEPPPTVPRHPIRRTKSLYIGLIAMLIALIVGSSILYALFVPKGTTTSTTSNSVVGQVLFLSSQNAPPGSLDEVQITLHSIPDAPSGKTYYAWLVYNSDSMLPVHWSLTVHNGSLFQPHSIDPHLLTTPMLYLFLITLQSQETSVPSFVISERLYYASISRTKSSFDIMQCPRNSSNNPCMS